MARVLALIPDLLFGSRVQGQLVAAGHEVELVGDARRVGEWLTETDVLVVDLTDPDLDGAALVRELIDGGMLQGVPTLGCYAHVDPAARERALAAGFDQVVPRSRMAREGAELVRALSPA
jgi:CheY-like chemotaxis protein